MPSFGENLRREREKRKFTLDQISQSTKIGTRMLQALEEDKFNQLPGGIFNKGFVRAYARCIGLDEEQTVAEYLTASGETPPVMPEIPQERPERAAPRIIEAREETPERPLPWGTFAGLLLLAALALTLWSHRQKKEQAAAPPPQPVATQPQPEAPPQPVIQRPAASAANPAPSVKVPSPASQQQKIAAAGSPATTPSPANPSAGSATSATRGFEIEIHAREDSWALVTADGKTVYSGTITAGDGRSIRGQKSVIVKAGNAGAVDLFFNGKRVPRIGEFGEVKIVTFGPEGMAPTSPPAPPTTQ